MPLFGKHDFNIPALTWFYQICSDEIAPDALLGSEFDWWAGSITNRDRMNWPVHPSPRTKFAQREVIPEGYITLTDFVRASLNNSQPSEEALAYYAANGLSREQELEPDVIHIATVELELLPEFHSIITKIMDSIANDEMASRSDMNRLNEFFAQEAPPRELLYLGPTINGPFHPTVRRKDSPGNMRFVRDLLDEFADAVNGSALARCDVCSSVFVKTAHHQTYCSWRCSNRQRVRRQRAKQNASLP